jgi:hypothetical protein
MQGGRQRNNRSGHRGVSWKEAAQKWVACIQRGNRSFHLGYFCEFTDAVKARRAAERRFARAARVQPKAGLRAHSRHLDENGAGHAVRGTKSPDGRESPSSGSHPNARKTEIA